MRREPAGIAPVLGAALTACAVLAGSGSLLGANDATVCERSHVRATDARAGAAIAYGIERSPTFRSLVEAIQGSDLIVYVSAQFGMAAPLYGETHFLTSAGDRRYLRVLIRGELSPWDRCAMVAHELQHAHEIASSPTVRDTATMDALYHQIGYDVGVDRHETDAARVVAARVMHELWPSGSGGTSR